MGTGHLTLAMVIVPAPSPRWRVCVLTLCTLGLLPAVSAMSLLALSTGREGRFVLTAARGERARVESDFLMPLPGDVRPVELEGGSKAEREGVDAELGRMVERPLDEEGGGEAPSRPGVDWRAERRTGPGDLGRPDIVCGELE